MERTLTDSEDDQPVIVSKSRSSLVKNSDLHQRGAVSAVKKKIGKEFVDPYENYVKSGTKAIDTTSRTMLSAHPGPGPLKPINGRSRLGDSNRKIKEVKDDQSD